MTDWTHHSGNPADISPGDPASYLQNGRRLQARAVGEALAATAEALAALPRKIARLATGFSRSALWRAPRSGNCLNC